MPAGQVGRTRRGFSQVQEFGLYPHVPHPCPLIPLAGRAWEGDLQPQPRDSRRASPHSSLSAGAFLIPYFIFLFGGGLPVFFLEVIIGQYTSEGGITCWEKICPLFAGECGTKVTWGLVFIGSANFY